MDVVLEREVRRRGNTQTLLEQTMRWPLRVDG
jgi:hypothetical protein